MTSDVQVTVRTDRATQDDISYQDYWEIYHFELRKWDESMARRDGKKSPDGKVLLGDYLLSLDDFCELHSPDMSKAMWSKIHKALREYVDLKLLIEDEKTAEESRTAALAASVMRLSGVSRVPSTSDTTSLMSLMRRRASAGRRYRRRSPRPCHRSTPLRRLPRGPAAPVCETGCRAGPAA